MQAHLIYEHSVGGVDALELILRARILVPVRMELQRQLPVGGLHVLLRGAHADAQRGIVAGLPLLLLAVHLIVTTRVVVGLQEVVVVARRAAARVGAPPGALLTGARPAPAAAGRISVAAVATAVAVRVAAALAAGVSTEAVEWVAARGGGSTPVVLLQ